MLADSPSYKFSSVIKVDVKAVFVGQKNVGPLVPSPMAAKTTPSQTLSLVVRSDYSLDRVYGV